MNRPDISSNQQAYAQARAFTPSEGHGSALGAAGALTAPYTCRVFNSIDDVDLVAWRRVCKDSGASVFLDPRFIGAVETSMKDCRFWYVIVDGDDGQPAACACLTAMTVDLLDFTDPRLAWVIRHGPKMLSRFRRLKTLFCSLPGSPGEKSLAFAPNAASARILPALDAVMDKLAAENGMDVIIYKEFGQDDLEGMQPLLARGYRRVEIPPMHGLKPAFESFAQYCAALKSRHRKRVTRSTKKLENSQIEQVVLTDPEEILRVYTPEVHAQYCDMVAKSDLKIEVLPIEYYRQLALRLKGQIDLIAFRKDSRIIGFGWCLHDNSTYHLMYAGIDYQLNAEFDLYFNLMFAGFDLGLRKRVAKINVGQTATVFKASMGCYSEPRHVFAKGLGPLMSRLFYYGANFLVIKKPSDPPADIFKRDGGETST